MWRNHMEIRSETSDRRYTVAELVVDGVSLGWGCRCPGWIGYGGQCKHLKNMGLPSCRPKGQPMPRGLGKGDNFAFTDESFEHYDTSRGYGSPEEWIRIAEEKAHGRRYYRARRESAGFYDAKMAAMKIFGFTSLPEDVKDLVRAMRRLAMQLHPDRGGDAREFDQMMQAYERLLRYYPRG